MRWNGVRQRRLDYEGPWRHSGEVGKPPSTLYQPDLRGSPSRSGAIKRYRKGEGARAATAGCTSPQILNECGAALELRDHVHVGTESSRLCG